jgi:spore germination protein
MTFRLLKAALLSALLVCGTRASAEAPKAWGYFGWWLPQSWRSMPLGQLDRLLFFELKVAPNGSIAERHGWPEQWTDLRLAVQQNNTPLDLTLTLFESAAFNTLFSSNEATRRLILEASSLADQPGVAGLQLDFEIYSLAQPQAIENYRRFVRELSARLRQQAPPRNLSVFLPIGGTSALYDAVTLAQVNHVVLQGYDAHWLDSKRAGPVAPLTGNEAVTWEKALAIGLALGVPAERLLLSFPLYGYEWPVNSRKLRSATIGKGRSTSFAPIPENSPPDLPFNVQDRVRQFGATHDSLSGSSYYQFREKEGQFVEGWFEDWWSLGRKVDFLVDRQLGGIAFFLLGYDDGQLVSYFLQRRGRRSLQDFIESIPRTDVVTPERPKKSSPARSSE